jgi:hypothetical protein
LWKCPTCGYQFNFQKLSFQRYLGNKLFASALTVFVMILFMFLLGFVADPIINLYVDPYDTIVGNEPYWSEVDVMTRSSSISGWSLHFTKGMISMGLVGFIKTMLLNPFNYLNIRQTGFAGTRRAGAATTGRDRAVNVSWIAVVIGITSAFYFFYKWVQTIIKHTLQRIGNHVVDTSLPGDDDDLKPPPDWKKPKHTERSQDDLVAEALFGKDTPADPANTPVIDTSDEKTDPETETETETVADGFGKKLGDGSARSADHGLSSAIEQEWSFVGIPRQR